VFKSINFKKAVFRILLLLIICFAFAYQKPILPTGKATEYAALCLQSPPKRLGINTVEINWDDIKPEKFSIDKKRGFLNQITNQRELSVTLKTKKGEELTVMMDAYNGRCLEVTGPFN
jgi:hypothetical protein